MKLEFALITTAALFAASASAARADCAPVVAAYAKADSTRRFAMFDVDGIAKEPKGEPFMVVIGDVQYTPNIVKKGTLNYELDGFKAGRYAVGYQADSLKEREKKGAVRCESLGERRIGAEQVIGYQIRSPGSAADPNAIHMWVSRATGLPLVHGMGSDDGMLRWVYGAAVVTPAPAKIHK